MRIAEVAPLAESVPRNCIVGPKGSWRRLRGGRTWNYDRRNAAEGTRCRSPVGEHGGAEGLALLA
jgi:hypothetical protein